MHFFWRLKHGDNLSKSSFLEALLGLEFGHADFADDADFSTYSVFGITQIYRMKESASSAQSACLKYDVVYAPRPHRSPNLCKSVKSVGH